MIMIIIFFLIHKFVLTNWIHSEIKYTFIITQFMYTFLQ
jgi:hypothetical protein